MDDTQAALDELLAADLIEVIGYRDDGHPLYALTEEGMVRAENLSLALLDLLEKLRA